MSRTKEETQKRVAFSEASTHDSCRAGFAPAEEWHLVTAHGIMQASCCCNAEPQRPALQLPVGPLHRHRLVAHFPDPKFGRLRGQQRQVRLRLARTDPYVRDRFRSLTGSFRLRL